MLRGLVLTILVLILPAVPVGCTTNVASGIPTEGNTTTIPDDFYIIFEVQYSTQNDFVFSPDKLVTLFDTKNELIGETIYYWSYDQSHLISEWFLYSHRMPRKYLQEIYDAIIEYDIKSYSSSDVLVDDPPRQTDYCRITFRANGEMYQVTFGDGATSDHADREKLGMFRDILLECWVEGLPKPY